MSTTPQILDGPLVSVIMPCRDGMPFVGSAVRRVLAQEVPLELLFVDAGSTDGTLQEVTSIDDDRIRVIEAPPGTQPGPARNLAARQAPGPPRREWGEEWGEETWGEEWDSNAS